MEVLKICLVVIIVCQILYSLMQIFTGRVLQGIGGLCGMLIGFFIGCMLYNVV